MGYRACPFNEVVAGVKVLCKAPSAALKAEKSVFYTEKAGIMIIFLLKTRQIVVPAGTELTYYNLDKCQRAQV